MGGLATICCIQGGSGKSIAVEGFSFLQRKQSYQPTVKYEVAPDNTKVSVAEVGDHSIKLSDGQTFASLNTGVALYPDFAGIWTPYEHQHKIRKMDIDLVAKPGVK